MKVLKHGRQYTKTPPVKVACKCGCEMEVDENDTEGGACSQPYVWCPECREIVFVPARLFAR